MNEFIVNNKNTLLKHEEKIVTLFKLSFGISMERNLWEWFYLKSPIDSPVVSLVYDGELLVGHYAVIPYPLNQNGKKLKSALSMTTMVHPDYRGRGLFTRQAESVYSALKKMNYDLVFGFPNENSVYGFQKKLNWNIEDNNFICTFKSGKDLDDYLNQSGLNDADNQIGFDIENEEFLKWRLSKPGVNYESDGRVITKAFGEKSIDIIYCSKVKNRKLFDINNEYNILLTDDSEAKLSILESEKPIVTKKYYFGYHLFSDDLMKVSFKKDLILSDVF